MAKYDYKCVKCGRVEERTAPIREKGKRFFCTNCEMLTMERQFSPKGTTFLVRWGKPRVRAKVKRMGA